MFDPRIYRAALLPALAAFVLLMFSLEPIPGSLQEPVSTPEFDGGEAARITRSIVSLAPSREPGSPGDAAVADLVQERFAAIEGGEVSVQDFDSTFGDEDVKLRNVVLTLPGSSEKTLLVVAHRDSAEGPDAAGSAAATAVLVGIAEDLGGSRHDRTIVIASTDGGSDGAEGARELIDSLPNSDSVESAIVISQPGVEDPTPPFVIPSGTGPESPSIQLVRTANSIAAGAFEERVVNPGPWSGLARLGVPVGLGEQAALRDRGIEAIALSAAGERPIPADSTDAQEASQETMQASGAIALDVVLTLDDADRAPATGPNEYIRLGDNLIPGWTLALLALTLLIPPLLAATDTWMRELRLDWRTRRSAFWAIERVLPPLASLLLAYLLGLIGLVPDPRFPYDPSRFPGGAEAVVAFVALVAAFVLAGLLIRPMRTPLDVEPHTLAAAGRNADRARARRHLAAQPLSGSPARAGRSRLAAPGPGGGEPTCGPHRDRRAALARAGDRRVPHGRRRAGPRHECALAPVADDRRRSDRPPHLPPLVRDARWACSPASPLLERLPASHRRRTSPCEGAGSHAGPGALGGTPSTIPRR